MLLRTLFCKTSLLFLSAVSRPRKLCRVLYFPLHFSLLFSLRRLHPTLTFFSFQYCGDKFSVEPVDVAYDDNSSETQTTPLLSTRTEEASVAEICSIIGVKVMPLCLWCGYEGGNVVEDSAGRGGNLG